MPVEVQVDKDEDTYYIKVGDKITITTTFADYDSDVKDWINEVTKIYGKNRKQSIVVGLSADRSCNYSNGKSEWARKNYIKKHKNNPYELLQLCVGNHCLLWDRAFYELGDPMPKCLKDFLADGKTKVVGVGIRKIVKKLEEETDLKIRNTIELTNYAKIVLGEEGRFSKATVQSLAKDLLGDKMDVPQKPNKLSWYSDEDGYDDDMVKFASLEVYLAARIGMRLIYRQ